MNVIREQEKAQLEAEKRAEEVYNDIRHIEESDQCKYLRYAIAGILGKGGYYSWCRNMKITQKDGHYIIKAKNEFYRDTLYQKIQDLCGSYEGIDFFSISGENIVSHKKDNSESSYAYVDSIMQIIRNKNKEMEI